MTGTFKIAGLILAAGLSLRYGPRNKLLREIGGKSMLIKVSKLAKVANLNPVIAVTGHQNELICKELAKENIEVTYNQEFQHGIGSSIACGVRAQQDKVIDGLVILLGDMPYVRPSTIIGLQNAFNPVQLKDICVPIFNGKQGNPILFGREHFTSLAALSGDDGGKKILAANQERIIYVELEDKGIHLDIDTCAT